MRTGWFATASIVGPLWFAAPATAAQVLTLGEQQKGSIAVGDEHSVRHHVDLR